MLNLHMYPDMKFPEGFLWGSATAAHQIEGDDIHSINWRDQQEGKCIEPSGKACNSYELYKEDVELIKELGHQAFRLSIPWSRIEPQQGHFCQEAVDHYVDFLSRLKDAGIKTFVTASHGSDPAWFADLGGWENRDNLPLFERYVEHIAKHFSPYVDFWMVINEIGLFGTTVSCAPIRTNYLLGHAKGYHILKSHSSAPVSSAHALRPTMPENPDSDLDCRMAKLEDWIDNEFFFHGVRTGEIVFPYQDVIECPELKDSCDYWAINYYSRKVVSAKHKGCPKRLRVNGLKLIDREFYLAEFYPEGFYGSLQRIKDKPVYITENGTCAEDDRWRIIKMCMDLCAIRDTMERGNVDVRGYLHWSLMDNYEWVSFLPRFGLVHVDFETFKRTPKPSSHFYKELIQCNGFGPELIKKYLPELPEFKLFAD